MGHNIEYFSYAEDCNRTKVQKELDSYAAHADWQEGCSGLYRSIRWCDTVPIMENYDAAVERIKRLDRRDYDQIAVRYYEPLERVNSKRLNELRSRLIETLKKRDALTCSFHFADAKSQYVGCKKCGSRLSVEYLGRKSPGQWNKCPVCGEDLRPKTTLDRIKDLEKRKDKILREMEQAQAEAEKRAKRKVMWCVKIEYHT